MGTEKISELIISFDASIMDALKQMDIIKKKILFVFKNDHFLTILTIGDIQRAIIAGLNITDKICNVSASNKVYAAPDEDIESLRSKMEKLRTDYMPVVDKDGELVDVILWQDIMQHDSKIAREKIDIPVVIMAGGLGMRLRPITNVIPKPLIPIGEKTILESILDQFVDIGCNKFYISVNYKFDLIQYYLNQLPKKYNIDFVKEDIPLGTIGSVAMLKDKIDKPFFVTNCDILINQDYRDVYDYHMNNNNDITVVTALKSYSIPYGVISTSEGGILTEIQEKPDVAYQINTGVYILNPEVIEDIPENELFHITHLIEKIRKKGGKIGCFPVSDGSWTDIGEWDQYLKLIDVL